MTKSGVAMLIVDKTDFQEKKSSLETKRVTVYK